MPFKYKEPIERLLANSVFDPVTECWNWTGYTYNNGRPAITVRENKAYPTSMPVTRFIIVYIHQQKWIKGKQKVNTGAHTCHNLRCVNPGHVKRKTQLANNREKPSYEGKKRKHRKVHTKKSTTVLFD